MPAAELDVRPGIGPRSDMPVALVHRKAWSGPGSFDSSPTIEPVALIPVAALEVKLIELLWISCSPRSLVQKNACDTHVCAEQVYASPVAWPDALVLLASLESNPIVPRSTIPPVLVHTNAWSISVVVMLEAPQT